MIKTGFRKDFCVEDQFPVHRLVLILSPAHRSDYSTIIQASIIQF